MLTLTILALGALFLLVTVVYLVIDRQQRTIMLGRLQLFRRRRATGSFTPPRSFSPEKQGLPASEPDFSSTFPPHRREALVDLASNALREQGMSAEELSNLAPDYSKEVSSTTTCCTDDLTSHVTATGISVAEIRCLGDFPDYAALSGVPLPMPNLNFDINKAKPRPYRPIRWAYHQTMSLTKLQSDWWLELESSYADRIKQRKDLYAKYGSMVLQALPGSEIATKELMEMCLQFLCARYPQYFHLDKATLTFHNSILDTTSSLQTTKPLHVLLDNVPEDFACMLRDESGLYSFRAGIICSSLGWNVGSKIGLKLHEIHEPIPDYKEKMQFSMDRYFARMPTDKPIQRGSWGLEIDKPLFMPPGDPHEQLREEQDPSHTIDRCHLRVDWQTLRRLPLSGAVVFNFKALFTPVTEFRDEPYIPSLLLKVLGEGKTDLMEYKNTWHTEHVVVPALEEYEREQVSKGLIEEDWQVHTLEESPFFPGWQDKWEGQQGF